MGGAPPGRVHLRAVPDVQRRFGGVCVNIYIYIHL